MVSSLEDIDRLYRRWLIRLTKQGIASVSEPALALFDLYNAVGQISNGGVCYLWERQGDPERFEAIFSRFGFIESARSIAQIRKLLADVFSIEGPRDQLSMIEQLQQEHPEVLEDIDRRLMLDLLGPSFDWSPILERTSGSWDAIEAEVSSWS